MPGMNTHSIYRFTLYWQLATGNWQLATGNWQLATGNWQLATGNWQLATGMFLCYLAVL
jgi:hypothetical protein